MKTVLHNGFVYRWRHRTEIFFISSRYEFAQLRNESKTNVDDGDDNDRTNDKFMEFLLFPLIS